MSEQRLIDANKIEYPEYFYTREKSADEFIEGYHQGKIDAINDIIALAPTVDAIPVIPGFEPGDVCIYGFHDANKSCSLVEIVKVLDDERGAAEVKFLKVFADNSGNGWFDYLLKTGGTMNASFKYLKNITPR